MAHISIAGIDAAVTPAHTHIIANMNDEIRALANRYAADLKRNMDKRVTEMERDDRSLVLIYQVLGVSESEGKPGAGCPYPADIGKPLQKYGSNRCINVKSN